MVHRAREKGIVLCEVYGSTESCPHVYVPARLRARLERKCQDAPSKGSKWRRGGRARDVPTGTQGEELSRGPNVFVGYLGNPSNRRSAQLISQLRATCARWTIADRSNHRQAQGDHHPRR